MSERTPLEFDTPMGPAWAAAKYLAVCAWPDSWTQRTKLVRALLHAGARAAGYRHPGPDARVLDRRLNRAAERLEKAFQAAEVLQLATLPPELQAGPIRLLLPGRHAVGSGGRVSLKRLQALAANDWEAPDDPRDLVEGDDEFRRRVWRRFVPALPYIIPLKMHIQAEPVDIVTLVRDTAWLEPALTAAERWREIIHQETSITAELIELVRE